MNLAVFALTLGLVMGRAASSQGVHYYVFSGGHYINFYHKRGVFTGRVGVQLRTLDNDSEYYLNMTDDEAKVAIQALANRKVYED